ncbi:MAG: hypothetical protein VB143_08415, partial [Burkholderia sp.]
LEEVRAAVVEFKDRYNRHWRLEKLGFMSPHEARQAATLKEAASCKTVPRKIGGGSPLWTPRENVNRT